ncbi:MAG: hypothetical protein GW855_05115 [Erythrobacter sp.]|nr:hypothetical protein [Erythrobacter sp.]
MAIFGARLPVSRDEFDWLIACFAWLRLVLDDAGRQLGSLLPDDPRLRDAATAGSLFEVVRDHCDMADWPVRLQQIDDAFRTSDIREVKEIAGPLGTYSGNGDAAVIQYSGALLRNPDALTATLAHELAHYLLEGRGDPPGGPDLLEHATDCAAVYLGCGIFLANSARHFEQFTDGERSGWRSSASGYLSEQALVCATALAATLNGHDVQAIGAHLKPYLRRDFRKACKAIAREHPSLEKALAAVDLLEWNYG